MFLTNLRLDLGLLNEHRFRHKFKNCMNPLCSCSLEVGDALHYLLHWHHFNHQQIDLMSNVNSVWSNNDKKDVLLYGESSF